LRRIIIDPITSYLGKVDSHKNADIRSVLEPIGKLAAKRHVTVIAKPHLSKAAGGSANSRVIGSVAFVNHARAAFIVTADPDNSGKRFFIPSKTNLGNRIAETALPGPDHGSVVWAPYVKWEDTPVTISADQVMAALASGPEGRSAIEEAKQFLLDVLSDQVMAALASGKDLLGVEAIREGGIGENSRWDDRAPGSQQRREGPGWIFLLKR
jgi:putative DNA primase/helicase